MRERPVTIYVLQPPLDKEQLRDAFAVSDTDMLWRGIMEMILLDRALWQLNEQAAVGANNPLALASAAGAVDALETLMNNLELKRVASNKN